MGQNQSDLTDRWQGATLAVVGGSGSFGIKLIEHVLHTGVREVRIVSRDEFKHDELAKRFVDPRVRFVIGDVRDAERMRESLAGVQYVFHAAALKQVPACEQNPSEAVKTNILGSENVLKAVHSLGAQGAVFLSTDKAVYPINTMGVSKAMMERLALASAGMSDCRVNVTRYGNVLFSRGSVLPYFIECAKRRSPLRLTDPAMTRFLLPLDEAISLVEHALFADQGGLLFVRQSAAATVETIARAVLAEFWPQGQIEVVGIRPGEKVHEALLTEEELSRATDDGTYFCTSPATAPTSTRRAYTSDQTTRLDLTDLRALIRAQPEMRVYCE